jgi:hypothetical protein
MVQKNFGLLTIALALLGTQTSHAFDVDQCPEQITVVYSNIKRISKTEVQQIEKKLYNYSTGLDNFKYARETWQDLAGVTEYTLQGKLSSKSDYPEASCTYLTGTGGVWAHLKAKYAGHGKFETYLETSTPFGAASTKVITLSSGALELSQDVSGRELSTAVSAGYEDGGYIEKVNLATAGKISAK